MARIDGREQAGDEPDVVGLAGVVPGLNEPVEGPFEYFGAQLCHDLAAVADTAPTNFSENDEVVAAALPTLQIDDGVRGAGTDRLVTLAACGTPDGPLAAVALYGGYDAIEHLFGGSHTVDSGQQTAGLEPVEQGRGLLLVQLQAALDRFQRVV